MKLELKNLEHLEALSQETPAFTAVLVVDGKERGTVRNDGRGGANHYSDRTVAREIDAYAKTLPKISFDGLNVVGLSIAESHETLIFGLVYDAVDAAQDVAMDQFRQEGSKQ